MAIISGLDTGPNFHIEDYATQLSFRYPSMSIALSLLLKSGGQRIVETGCARLKGDWGGGLSTFIFGLWAASHKGEVWTVDNNAVNMETCKEITKEQAPFIEYVVSDSVAFLLDFKLPIDLLYLDSFDYPYGELLNLYGGREDIHKAMDTLRSLGDAEIIMRHRDLISPCQNHCLAELKAAEPNLRDLSLVMIDDANIPGGGKARLAAKYLFESGWQCLWKDQQMLFARPDRRGD